MDDKDETISALAGSLAQVEAEVKDALRRQYDIRSAIEQVMVQAGSMERKGDGWAVTLRSETIWHKELLTPLKEIVPLNILAENGFFEEHTKVVPESWNMTRIKGLKRHSAEARRIIEGAEEIGPPKLTITLTKED